MSLILMAVYDTRDNNRTWCTGETLECLRKTIDWGRHRLIIIDNDSCDETKELLDKSGHRVITLPENIGQARALNKGLQSRGPDEVVIRIDNDVVIYHDGWADEMEYVVSADPSIAALSLKRPSAWEHPGNNNPAFQSRLEMLSGNSWMVIEVADSVLGTCQALNPRFLDKIGSFYQMGSLWGFIDPIVCAKAKALGYKTAYLPHIKIDHLDEGVDIYGNETGYQIWKGEQASELFARFEQLKSCILSGKNIYNGPEDE